MQTDITSNSNYNTGTSRFRDSERNSGPMTKTTDDSASNSIKNVDQENHRSANKQALISRTVSSRYAKTAGLVNLENRAPQKSNAPIDERSAPGVVKFNSEAVDTLGNSATRGRVRRWAARGRVAPPPRPRVVPRPVHRPSPPVSRRVDSGEARRQAARLEAQRQAARLEAQRQAARLEAQRQANQRAEQQRQANQRAEQQRQANQRIEQQRRDNQDKDRVEDARRIEQQRRDDQRADQLRVNQRADQERKDAQHANQLQANQRADQERKDAQHANQLQANQRADQERKDTQGEDKGSVTDGKLATVGAVGTVGIASGGSDTAVKAVSNADTTVGVVRLNAAELKLSRTVENHLADLSKGGTVARPYGDSRLLMQEIMDAKPPIPDPGGVPGALRWDVQGTMNGAEGTYELVVDPNTGTVLHFLFKK